MPAETTTTVATPTPPVCGVPVARAKWFEHLFGFREDAATAPERLEHDEVKRTLKSKVNDVEYGVGHFATPSLAELRDQLRQNRDLPKGELVLSHIATKDVFELHSCKLYEGAVFQVASQFNCLEFASPDVTPEMGVTNYIYDSTQGPACSLAAPAATVLRNYFVQVPKTGQRGQTAYSQLNLLDDLLQTVQGSDGEAGPPPKKQKTGAAAAGQTPEPLIEVANGYTSSDEPRLQKFNRWLTCYSRDELAGKLKIGFHQDVEVPWSARRFVLLPPGDRQKVSQAFCSALACGYSDGSAEAWEPLATLVLDASYEATLTAAALRAVTSGSNKVLLTALGGGVFGNRDEWIDAAIAKACVKLRNVGLEVILCHFGSVDSGRVGRLESLIKQLSN